MGGSKAASHLFNNFFMKKSKTYNNISDKLQAMITPLKRGESVVFKMLNGVPNPDPDPKEKEKDPVLYPKMQLMTKFRIWDPYKKDEDGKEVGGYVDIVLADSWNGDNPTAERSFVTGQNPSNSRAQMASRFQGKFELRGGNVREEELYEVLFISPQRKGTPCPDDSVAQIFEIVNANTESKTLLTKYDTLKKAIDIAKDIKREKALEIMAALNQPTYQDEVVLMAKIKEFASNKPDEFIKVHESSQTPIIATFKKALDSGVLTYDHQSGEVKNGTVFIVKLKSESFDTLPADLAQWASTAENGKDVVNNINSQIKAKGQKV